VLQGNREPELVARLRITALAIWLLGASAAGTQPDSARLIGLWGANVTFDPGIHGPVSVRRTGSSLQAFASGFAADGALAEGGVIFRFPGGRGELRTRPFDRDRVTAMWVQPTTLTSGVQYATPVDLTSIDPGVWRGTILPQGDRVEVYLRIVSASDGTLTGFFRDPLANVGAFNRIVKIEPRGNGIRFVTHDKPIDASFDRAAGSLTLTLPQLPALLTFTRRDELHAPGFFPRTPPRPTEAYHKPLPTGDGWTIASPGDVGLDAAALVSLVAHIASQQTTDLRSPYVHSIAVARHGKLVLDEYFAGFDEATLHDLRSAGKTYADVLVGIAQFRGAPIGAGTPLLSLYPLYSMLANDDPRKPSITVGNALSMSTGLDCDDNDEKSKGNEDAMQSQTQQLDWYRLVLDAKMVRDPGMKAVYCSGSTNLVGGAIANATHQWLPFFFEEQLAGPLQMQGYALNLTPTGEMYLGGGAYVRPRDFLKVGQLYLDGGVWHGRRLLARDWIDQSWRTILTFGPGHDYGYAWHVLSSTVGGTTYQVFEAQGNGGQILDAIPQLDLAVMITQGNYQNFTTWGATRDAIVQRVIAAAAR
jgi:CubicO group peptidase (beta-lactamase class C family)